MIWIFLRLFIGYGLQMFPWAFLCFYPFRDSLGVKRNFNSVLVIFISALDIIFSSVCCVLRNVLPAEDILFFWCNLVFFLLLAFCIFFYFYPKIPNKLYIGFRFLIQKVE